MVSTTPYTVKVIGEWYYTSALLKCLFIQSDFLFSGQSAIDILFDFVEMSQGPSGGFYSLETRPRAGKEN